MFFSLDSETLKQEHHNKPDMPFYLRLHVEHVPKAKAVTEPKESSLASVTLNTAADIARSTINFARQSMSGSTASSDTKDNSDKVVLRNSFFVHDDNKEKLPYRKEFWFAIPSNRYDRIK